MTFQINDGALMIPKIAEALEKTDNVTEVFDLVKDVVVATLGESRAGINIGLMELGNSPNGITNAFYPVGSNVIVLNKSAIRRMMQTDADYLKPYLFTILLHEYLHSLGYLDERTTRLLTYRICAHVLGKHHVSTELAKDMNKFLPLMMHPGGHPAYDGVELIEVAEDDYIG